LTETLTVASAVVLTLTAVGAAVLFVLLMVGEMRRYFGEQRRELDAYLQRCRAGDDTVVLPAYGGRPAWADLIDREETGHA
jgi:hypothetical protein